MLLMLIYINRGYKEPDARVFERKTRESKSSSLRGEDIQSEDIRVRARDKQPKAPPMMSNHRSDVIVFTIDIEYPRSTDARRENYHRS